MANGDIVLLADGPFGTIGSRLHKVQSGAAATIAAGELVLKALGSPYVVAWTTSSAAKPVVATDFLAGLSASASTETASADGYVEIIPLVPGQVFLANPNAPTSWDTQAEYDLLVGDRVLLNCSSAGVQTILASDGATSGLVIQPLNIATFPAKVAFSIRAGASYLE